MIPRFAVEELDPSPTLLIARLTSPALLIGEMRTLRHGFRKKGCSSIRRLLESLEQLLMELLLFL